MQKLILATSNPSKVQTMREVLAGLPVQLQSLAEAGVPDDAPETGNTYEHNAHQKAAHYAAASGLGAIAEDSGIDVRALPGELGVHTRHWGAGAEASDEAWLAHLLERMRHEDERCAVFYSCIALHLASGERHTFVGKIEGTLLREPRGLLPPRNPVSAVFVPVGSAHTLAEMSPEMRNSISHRGQALALLVAFLQKHLAA